MRRCRRRKSGAVAAAGAFAGAEARADLRMRRRSRPVAAGVRGRAPDARIVVVGVCMETDRSEPMLGIMKELNVQYVLGYTPEEFAYSLRLIAEGEVDAASLVTAQRRHRRRRKGVRRSRQSGSSIRRSSWSRGDSVRGFIRSRKISSLDGLNGALGSCLAGRERQSGDHDVMQLLYIPFSTRCAPSI